MSGNNISSKKNEAELGFGETGLNRKGCSVFQEGGGSSKILLGCPAAQEDGRGRTTYFLRVSAEDTTVHSHTTGRPLARGLAAGLGSLNKGGRWERGIKAQAILWKSGAWTPAVIKSRRCGGLQITQRVWKRQEGTGQW